MESDLREAERYRYRKAKILFQKMIEAKQCKFSIIITVFYKLHYILTSSHFSKNNYNNCTSLLSMGSIAKDDIGASLKQGKRREIGVTRIKYNVEQKLEGSKKC